MSIKKLEYFISVAECLSFTNAAKKHFLSQTAISQNIASLESEIGVKLFDRNKHHIALTKPGEIFYEDIKNILKSYSYSIDKVKSINNNERCIRISYSNVVEKEVLFNLSKKFMEKNPDIEIKFIKRIVNNLHQPLFKNNEDIVFILSNYIKNIKNLNRINIYHEKLLLAVSKEEKLDNKKYINWDDINFDKILLTESQVYLNDYKKIFNNQLINIENEEISNLKVDHETVMLLIELNKGYAFIPDIPRARNNKRINCLEIIGKDLYIDVDMIWQENMGRDKVNEFIKFVKNEMNGEL